MRALILGFDGASPRLIDEWIDVLPTFRRFKEEGIFGQTIPPLPAQTPVAWTTFMTGKNPGNHGIFSFAMRKRGTYERKIIRAEMVESRTLWRILSEEGKRVGVINVPMSRVEEVRGFIIPGFLSRSEGIPCPNGVRDKLRQSFKVDKLVGDLETETLERVGSDPDLFFERVNQITDEMAEISLYLLQEEEWDFFMAVFMGTDRIHHFFWRHVDRAHPRYEESEYSRLVKDFYVKADRIVSGCLNSVREDILVMVISDHGFCPVHKEVMVNNYLEELGFLETRDGRIDLEKSKAVSYGYGDVWLNVRGREPNGLIDPGSEYEATRDAIIDGLRKLRIDGESPFKDIRRREEIYWGRRLNEAPDLTIVFNVGWQAARSLDIARKNESKRYVNDNPRWSGGHDGTHDPTDVPGFLGILGPGIRGGRQMTAHLWDMAPTILSLMDVPIPNDMDGRPLPIAATTKRAEP
ncbi:TPA: hypothetical protein EYP44_04355 [Candidatus Bathyarchaeota archaeon]|nr:hypothetical protein [Candidatus Bathyarchaeota archaeon]